jgi:hypothetical protein
MKIGRDGPISGIQGCNLIGRDGFFNFLDFFVFFPVY